MATTQSSSPIPTFSTASAAWFEDKKRYIKPNTADSYGDALGPLNRFFGDKPIDEIAIVHLRMYQDIRSAKVCAHTVNRELGVLQQVLREFDEWKRLELRTGVRRFPGFWTSRQPRSTVRFEP
jgi:Phage integrase, N-terminal SAM-like domain